MLQPYIIVEHRPTELTIRLATGQEIDLPTTTVMEVDGANTCRLCGRDTIYYLDAEVVECNCDGTFNRYYRESQVPTVIALNRKWPSEEPEEIWETPPVYVSEWPSDSPLEPKDWTTQDSNQSQNDTTTTTHHYNNLPELYTWHDDRMISVGRGHCTRED